MIFTQLLFGQPHFPIARFILRPLFGYLGRTGFYNVLWSFAGSTISNVGFFQGLVILFGIRRYIYGTISITTLADLIFNRNAMLGFLFNNVVRTDLITFARRNLVSQFAPRRLINIIIINSFLFLINSFIKFIIKIIVYFGFTILSILFFMSFENVKYITKFAKIVKNVLHYYLHIDFPVNEILGISEDIGWLNKLTNYYNKLISYFSFHKNIDKKSYVKTFESHNDADSVYNRNKKYDQFKDDLVKDSNNNNFNNNKYSDKDNQDNINDLILDNICCVSNNNLEVSNLTDSYYFYIDFLVNLFNEFNLFI